MKKYIGFVKKEFYHIIRDKKGILILFMLPVIQILLFGFAITNEIRNAKVAILDLSKDAHTQKITQKILSSRYFLLYGYLNTFDDIQQAFRKGLIKQVIVFERDFAKNLDASGIANIQLISDATEPNTGVTLLNYTTMIVQSYQAELNRAFPTASLNITETRMRFNPSLKGVYLFVPGLASMILMLISALMTSVSITREKEFGTMELLLASPVKPLVVIIAKVTPYSVISFLIAIIILVLGKFVFGVPVVGSLAFLLGVCVLYIVAALSLGILISTIAQNQLVAIIVSFIGLMLPTILLSGFMFPIENMPFLLQILCYIIPATWFLKIIRAIMLKGAGIVVLWREVLILCGFIAVYITIGTKKFKTRLE